MILAFNWEGSSGVQAVLGMIENILKIIRWVVPIGLIFMTSLDVAKKVINPEDKDGMKKILYRVVAALIVFLLPTIINLVLKLVDIGNGNTNGGNSGNGSSINNGGNGSSTNNSISSSDVKILYCPTTGLYIGNTSGLAVSVPDSYKGNYYWHVDKGNGSVHLYPQNNGKTLYYTINSYPENGEIIISVSVDGGKITKSCYINVLQKNKDEQKNASKQITNLSINNCPSNNKIYDKGDVINLKAIVEGNYFGEIKWSIVSSKNVVSATTNNNGSNATIKILDYYAGGQVLVEVTAQDKKYTCPINIAIKERTSGNISIIGCPKDKIKVGERINLYTNLGTSVTWNNVKNDVYGKFYNYKQNNDGSVTLTVIQNYLDNLPMYIKVKDNNGNEGECSLYTYE